jgi:uncharacterized membrane protein
MDIYTVNSKPYRRFFLTIISMNVLFIAGSYLAIQQGLNGMAALLGTGFAMPLLGLMIVLAIVHTLYQRRQLAQLSNYTDFEEKLSRYERIYRIRMLWYLFSCVVACILYLIFERKLFLLFALLDLVTALPFYPAVALFRKELKNDEVIITSY